MKGAMGRDYGKKDMVFCLIYCDDAKPYENYDIYLNSENDNSDKLNKKTSLVMAMLRTDGMIGFPGGNVEKHHKSLIEALKSELDEEINFTELDESRVEKIYTSVNMKRHITIYSYKVSYEEIKKIYRDSIDARHIYSENSGTILLNINKKSIRNIMQHNFLGTSKNDLQLLINRKKLIKDE